MRQRMKTNLVWFTILVSCLLFASSSLGQEMPKPGDVIDKSNYKKYAHLFPEEFLPYFENGFEIIKPISIKVSETKPTPVPKKYLTVSEKNLGKVTLDKDGLVVGYDFHGFPFPDVKPGDKDFATKLMWNFQYRYYGDDIQEVPFTIEIRRGQKATWSRADAIWMYFYNRLYMDPKPVMKTPNNLFKVLRFIYKEPPGMKNLMFLTHRYADVTKSDDTYLYLPTMRRVLRGEAGQRSTPVQGSTQALDDFNVFDGRPFEFTYEFVKEQKVLGVPDNRMTWQEALKNIVPISQSTIQTVGWELKDVYVIDIKAKDAKYPQSKKRIYLDKENFNNIYYAIAWDRAGKLWKVWYADNRRFTLPDGDIGTAMIGLVCVDVQFGLINCAFVDRKMNTGSFEYADFMPSTLLKLAK